tara:strand:+ start:569 stop:694 length:126 start_codon:yes stop_codon:yes gene_type:complete
MKLEEKLLELLLSRPNTKRIEIIAKKLELKSNFFLAGILEN